MLKIVLHLRSPDRFLLQACCLALTMVLVSSLIQTKRNYELNFNYGPFSKRGPSYWAEIEANVDRHDEWADFYYFMGNASSDQDLDMEYNECSSVRRPSPVHLVPNAQCEDNHEILTRQITSGDCLFSDMRFEITPNTLRASMPYNDSTCLRPTIDMSGDLPNDWMFTWLEVHVRSEHVIDGRRFDGEINLMHIGTSEQYRELAIPSILLEASAPRDEPRFQRLLDKWQEIANEAKSTHTQVRLLNEEAPRKITAHSSMPTLLEKYRYYLKNSTKGSRFYPSEEYRGQVARKEQIDHNVTLERSLEDGSTGARKMSSVPPLFHHKVDTESPDITLDDPLGPIRKMFPYDLWPTIYYYRYKGSITYPPCSENVQWRVFDQPLLISRRQYKQLASLLESYVNETPEEQFKILSPTGENVRPLFYANATTQNVTHCTYQRYRYWSYPWRHQ